MTASIAVLEDIAHAIIRIVRSLPPATVNESFVFEDYHGLPKTRIPEAWFRPTLEGLGYTPESVRIEIVRVLDDLRHATGRHHRSMTYIVVLGEEEHAAEPLDASAYIEDGSFGISLGTELEIPPGTVHGFSVRPGGTLTLLSVQSPPAIDGAGNDDFECVSVEW